MTNFFKPRGFSLLRYAGPFGLSVGVPMVGAGLIVALFDRGFSLNAIPVFLVGIMFVASISGVQAAIIAAVSSFVLLTLIIIEPRFSLQFVSNDDYLNMLIFLVVALIAGYLSGLARDKGRSAIEKAKQLEALFDAASRVLTCQDTSAVYKVILETAERITPQDWYIERGIVPVEPLGSEVTATEMGELLPGSHGIIIHGPLSDDFLRAKAPTKIPLSTQKSLEMLAKLAEGALKRIQVQRDLEDAKVTAASDELRATILNSVAHDLRTPLSSIAASAATLEDHHQAIPEVEKIQLARSIRLGAERLRRFISKLLTAAQIESGPIHVQLQVMEIRDLVGGVLDAFTQHHHEAGVQWDGSGADLEISCDPILLDQAIFNVIENCLDYAPPSEPVMISVLVGEELCIEITDRGPGIPANLRDYIFGRWTRAQQPSRARTGLGLGLSISRGFIQAIGGRIVATDKRDGSSGACFQILFPMTMVRSRNDTG